jgi:broad specificity phosphatase PhoE
MPSYTIYLSRHGESLANVGGVIGGDASLSQRGSAYAARLCQYIESETPHDSPVWTSALRRTLQTMRPLVHDLPGCRHSEPAVQQASSTGTLRHPLEPWSFNIRPGLNEIDAGLLDGMSETDACMEHPDIMAARKADKLNYRYPAGESYVDLIERVGAECAELHTLMQKRASAAKHRRFSRISSRDVDADSDIDRAAEPTCWVIAHQATLRVVIGYFQGIDPVEIPHLVVPLHTVFQMVVQYCPTTGARAPCQLRQIYL